MPELRTFRSRIAEELPNTGYRALALDLQVLSLSMKEQWSQIGPKTALSAEELLRAVELANRLHVAIGQRDQGPHRGVEEAAPSPPRSDIRGKWRASQRATYASPNDPRTIPQIAAALADPRARGLDAWSIGEPELVPLRTRHRPA